MDVIANNIANVNTVGFKSSRVTFADAFYQRIQGATPPDTSGFTGRAGTNPFQIGLGLNLGSIDNIMTQGASQRTDNALDVAIQGGGFLIVNDASGTFFTRAGNISRDFHNNLHINGMQLMGWSTRVVDGETVVDRNRLVPLQLSGPKQNMPAEPTTRIDWIGNLNASQLDENDQILRTKRFTDSLGHEWVVDLEFTYQRAESSAPNSPHSYWDFQFLPPTRGQLERMVANGHLTDAEVNAMFDAGPPPVFNRPGYVVAFLEGDRNRPSLLSIHADQSPMPRTGAGVVDPANPELFEAAGRIAFNSRGEVVGMGAAGIPFTNANAANAAGANGGWGAAGGWITAGFNFDIVPRAGVNPAATFGNRDGMQLPPSNYNPGDNVPPPMDTVMTSVGNIQLDLSEFFQRGGMNTTFQIIPFDGNPPGTLQDISVGTDGTIMGRFSNGRTRVLGQIPLAFFRNPPGLERVGNNLWVPTANSGQFDGIGLIGQMQGGALEMSNVDLANEFTEMITTQRGFQAASRTITVSDEMLQELVNLRR